MSQPEADLVEVYLAADVTEAHFLRDRLEEAGIKAEVVGEGLVYPPGETIRPRIWVFRADESRARELLLEYEKIHSRPHPDDDIPADTWQCPTCGEAVDAEFDLCWNCQTPRKPY